jgi:hypothetical protein
MGYPEVVQVNKQESTALGGDDADSDPSLNVPIDPFEDVVEAAGFEVQEPDGRETVGRDHLVRITRLDGELLLRDALNTAFVTLSELLAGEGGLTPTTHRALDQLVHGIAENSYTETETTSGKITAVRTYTNSGKTLKIREEDYTYTGNKVTTVVTKQYDAAGDLAETYTETIAYTGAVVDTITGVLS